MDVNSSAGVAPSRRVLVVADWRTEPGDVIRDCRERAASGDVAFALVVPAWLHGLDWVGDPLASRPCAARQLETLVRLATSANLDVRLAGVGDPDPASAVGDALETFAATEILLCQDRRRRGHPLDRSHRLRWMTGLPVDTPADRSSRAHPGMFERRGRRGVLRGGHCVAEPSQTQ